MAPDRLAALDRGQADAAAGAVHQQRLAGMQVGPPAQRAVGRAVGDGETGGGDVVHVVRQRHHVVGAGHRLLGEGAVTDHGQHALARLEAAHAGAARPRSRRRARAPGVNGSVGFSW